MTDRTCQKCNEVRPDSLFAKRNDGAIYHVCRPCQNAQARQRWANRPKVEKDPAAKPCAVCKKCEPEVSFYVYPSGHRDGWCRTCRNERQKVRNAALKTPKGEPVDVSKHRAVALALAERPNGMSSRELAAAMGVSMFASKRMIARLCEQGLLFRQPGMIKSHRVFASAEAAEAYQSAPHTSKQLRDAAREAKRAAPKPPKPPKPRPVKTAGTPAHRQKALTVIAAKPKAPTSHDAFLKAAPQITSQTLVIVAQTHPSRFSVDWAPSVISAAECRPWAAAAASQIGA